MNARNAWLCGLFALYAAITVACAKSSAQSRPTATATASASSTPFTSVATMTTFVGVGSVTNGRRIFANNCATCHGAGGTQGGVGPSLKDERARKDYEATIAWIKNPDPPMPALYPSPLSERAVDDVAAYVQSL
ncbi:MAG TPA: c-type cytochrome [Candidatus Acidoferrales bacterium]|nr:c-type cytochrome [Candidatus Acidoferrales bacterium]